MNKKWVLYIDKDGNEKIKLSDEYLKWKSEEKERKDEEKRRVDKKDKCDYWLNRWKTERRLRKQERFIKWLRAVVPKERWELYGEKTIRKFVGKIDVKDLSECWEWLDAATQDGYGTFRYKGSRVYAHRFMYILIHGEIPKDKPYVTHTCNNRMCANSKHLNPDTHDGNMKYMVECCRSHNQKGENNGNSKLEWNEVNEIRKKYKIGVGVYYLASDYDIPKSTVYRIVSNKSWYDKDYQKWLDDKCKSK